MAEPGLFAEFHPREDRGQPRGPLPEGVILRQPRAEDAAGMAVLIATREGRDPAQVLGRCKEELSQLPADDRVLFVAARDAEVVGFGRAKHVTTVQFAPGEPAGPVPEGWYLTGLIVAPPCRRCGIGAALTRQRLAWIAGRAPEAFYFANSLNLATIDLHAQFGFTERARDFKFPGARFSGGGGGILFHVDLRACWDRFLKPA